MPSGYKLSVRVIEAEPGTVLHESSDTVAGKADLLKAVTTLADRVRTALGDTTPEAQRLKGAESFTASTIEAAQSYAIGQQLSSAGKVRGIDRVLQARDRC